MCGGSKKGGPLSLTRQVLLSWDAACAAAVATALGRHRSDQVEDKRPKALALATACVRLWTSSLP